MGLFRLDGKIEERKARNLSYLYIYIYIYIYKCDVLFSITSIFNFMFIILFVATATLDGLPPYRTVLNYFHLLWLYLLYPLLGWLCRLPCWFYSIAFTYSYSCITFNLYCYCITMLPLPTLCPFPFYGIRAILFWPVIVVLCSLSLRLCLPKTLILRCCVPFLPSLAPP